MNYLRLRLIAAFTVFAALLYGSAPVYATSANPAPSPDPQSIFSAAHDALGGGGTFTQERCANAVPLPDQVIALTSTATGESGPRTYALLERGFCKLLGSHSFLTNFQHS